MRLLCLHGRGTSSDIFETQLGPLKSLLKNQVEFDFIDAPFEGAPAPGIEIFEPPYFIWNRYYAPSEVSKVHDYVRAVVCQDGPYDGVIGFSEGAALAAALLLEDASGISGQYAPMFRFALFFNAVNLVSPSTALGRKLLESDMQNAVDTFTHEQGKHHHPALDCVYALCARTVPVLINVPTLHVIGLNDGFRDYSEDLIKLCEGRSAMVVRSWVGHEIPRGSGLAEVARKLDTMITAELLAT